MRDDPATAFDPESRAASLGILDRISLTDHVVTADIGAFEEERGRPQRLRFDIVVEVAGQGAPSDDVDRILSYDRLSEAVAAELSAGRVALLETLADNVAARILREPQAARVILRVQKLDRGPGDLGVEIVRARAASPAEAGPPAPLAAEVRLLAPAEAPPLDAPRVLLPSAPAGPTPPANTPEAKVRIDLLALDQAAWALARLELPVAATLTEIDWAIRRGRSVLWAPARLAVDAGLSAEPDALAAWLRSRLRGGA